MDFPDLESVNSLELAAVHDIDRVIEKILDDGEYEPPDPLQNLEYGTRMLQLAYLRARQDGAPKAHLALARQWIDEATAMLAAGASAAPGAVPGAETLPPGGPMDAAAAGAADTGMPPEMPPPGGLPS